MASYNSFSNNIVRDTLVIVLGNALTSIFAGFAVFSILGFIANELNKRVKDVAAAGIFKIIFEA